MTIRIRVIDEREVTAHCTPSWWEFWRGETDERAIAVPSIYGLQIWVSDRTNRCISDQRVIDAIERAVALWHGRRAVTNSI